MAVKKTVAKAAKPAVETKAVKAEATKAAAKTTEKAAEAKTTETAKKAPAKKTTARKTPAKRTTTKKAAVVTEEVYLQYAGKEFSSADLTAKNGGEAVLSKISFDNIVTYGDYAAIIRVKSQDGWRYYVINNEETGSFGL